MKTKILSFLFVLSAALLISTSAFAQPTTSSAANTSSVTALDGMTSTFTVGTGTGTFVWALTPVSVASGNTGTSAAKLATDVTAQTDNSITITWDAASANDTYKVTVYLKSGDGCYSELLTYNVTINSAVIDLTASQSATTCSWLAAATGVSGNVASSADQVVLNTTATGGITPASITYTIYDGTTLVDTRSATAVALNSGQFTVTIDSKFVNTSGSDKNFTIKLASAKDASENDMTVGTTSATIKIHSVPTIAF